MHKNRLSGFRLLTAISIIIRNTPPNGFHMDPFLFACTRCRCRF